MHAHNTLSSRIWAMAKKMKQFHALLKCRPERCLFSIRHSWLGAASIRFQKTAAVKQSFIALEPSAVFSTKTTSFRNQQGCIVCCTQKTMIHINFHAAVHSAVPPNDYRTEYYNMFPCPSVLCFLCKNAYFLPLSTNFLPSPIFSF